MSVFGFACPHGAGKSRVAAAWFDAAGLPGWRAVSFACEVPDPAVSADTGRLLAGTDAEAFLDRSRPRARVAERVDRAVVIDGAIDGAIHGELPDTIVWRLTHRWPSAEAAEEIRALVADLVADLTKRGEAAHG